MEKRERRERHQRNQVLKQRYGAGPRQEPTDKSNRPEVKEKKVIDHTAIPDPHMFDNLKRETDDIAALTDRKYSGKRQIFSNWAKYETPPEEPEDDQPIGADYETMIQSAQIGSQFQFRSERHWDPKHLPVQSAAFTIDLGVLAASLACLPLYEKLLLPLDVFSNEEVEHMERQARNGQEAWKYKGAKGTKKEGLPIWTLEKLTDIPSDKIVSQLSSMAADTLCDNDTSKDTKHTPDKELTPEKGGKECFDFGDIPIRGSSEDTCSPTRKEKPLGLSLREQTPEPAQLVPKQYDSLPLEEQTEESTPKALSEQPLPKQQRPAPLKVQEELSQEQPAMAVEATSMEKETKELPARKKPRGGKNKAGKRRSWGADGEESPVTPATATPQPQEDRAKNESPREQPAQHQAPSVTKEVRGAHSTPLQEAQSSSPTERQAPPREERARRMEQAIAVPKQMSLQQTEEKREQRKPSEEAPADTGTPLHKGTHKTDLHQPDKPEEQLNKQLDKPPQNTAPPDDQLDFLLSLRKPVPGKQVINFAVPTSAVPAAIDEDEPVPCLQSPEREKKTEDLEDWLDSMLDD